jgi:DNA-binding transcriptional LysR family regulator
MGFYRGARWNARDARYDANAGDLSIAPALNMNLKQLETFVQIVDKRSFSAAAEALCTTQSTVSARVKDLEHYFGVELFDRSSHRAQLTAKGRELFSMSQQVVGLMDQLRSRIGDSSALSGTVRLGAVGLVASTWLPALISELRARHPALELQVEVALSRALAQRLKGGQLDIAIVAGPVDDDTLCSELLGEDEFAWMAAPSLQVPRGPLTPAQLAEYPIVSFSHDSHHHAVIKSWFKGGGVRFQAAVICNSMDVIAKLVLQGLGLGLLPSGYYGAEISLGRLEVLQTSPPIPSAQFVLVSPADRQTGFVSAVTDAVKAVRRAVAAGR